MSNLVLEQDLTDDLVRLPIAVISPDNNGVVHLDDSYIPPTLYSQKNPILAAYISETYGLLSQKAKVSLKVCMTLISVVK